MKLGRSTESLDFSAKESDMADGELAADLMEQVIGVRGVREPVKSMLERAYEDLRKRNKEWTGRRVRAVFNKEANRIDHREIQEMRAVVAAREKHAAYREETARLASVAVVRAPAQHGDMAP